MALPKPDDLLALAHITRPHGVHGEMSAVPLTPSVLDGPALLDGRVYLRTSGEGNAKVQVREANVLSVRAHQDRWLITLEGVESMDDANALREVDVCLTREELPALPEGWYWEEELLGCKVIDATLGEIGTVSGIDEKYVQPQLELKRPQGHVARIPWVGALVGKVDLEKKEVHVDLPAEYPGISD